MKILGGNQVVFYTRKSGNFEIQLSDCLEQLEDYMDEFQIYPGSLIRHNIFVDVADSSTYHSIKPRLEQIAKQRFPLPMLVNVIAQKPFKGDLALESTHIKSTQWNCLFKETKYGSCQLMKHGKDNIVLGAVQVNESRLIKDNAEKAFEQIEELLEKCGLAMGDLVKQWSYIENMLDASIQPQPYQTFNDVRTRYYDNDFTNSGFPASTEVGIQTGGLIIEFMAVNQRNSRSIKIDNPAQKAPQEYSQEVLANEGAYEKSSPTSPKLERARSLTIDKKTMIFISGTSSIIGERITAIGDAREQTFIALENFKKIIEQNNLKAAGLTSVNIKTFTLLKAYVKSDTDFQTVKSLLNAQFENVPMLVVQTDLPRKEILVELEAELMI